MITQIPANKTCIYLGYAKSIRDAIDLMSDDQINKTKMHISTQTIIYLSKYKCFNDLLI